MKDLAVTWQSSLAATGKSWWPPTVGAPWAAASELRDEAVDAFGTGEANPRPQGCSYGSEGPEVPPGQGLGGRLMLVTRDQSTVPMWTPLLGEASMVWAVPSAPTWWIVTMCPTPLLLGP